MSSWNKEVGKKTYVLRDGKWCLMEVLASGGGTGNRPSWQLPARSGGRNAASSSDRNRPAPSQPHMSHQDVIIDVDAEDAKKK